MVKYNVLYHASIRFEYNGLVIYCDPFKIDREYNDADLVFITHPHYDHYSIDDIRMVSNEKTHYIAPLSTKKYVKYLKSDNVTYVNPNKSYDVLGVSFNTVRAYNSHKPFHKKRFDWLGYILNLDNETYYVMGDTDENEDVLKVKADYVFVPIGGTYTFDAAEAANYINKVAPKVVIPIHYGKTINNKKGIVNDFTKKVNNNIKIEVQLKED